MGSRPVLRIISKERNKEKQMTSVATITFDPNDTKWDDDRHVMKFHAVAGTARIVCAISLEGLGDHFGKQARATDIFSSNRGKIEGIAEKLIRHGRLRKTARY